MNRIIFTTKCREADANEINSHIRESIYLGECEFDCGGYVVPWNDDCGRGSDDEITGTIRAGKELCACQARIEQIQRSTRTASTTWSSGQVVPVHLDTGDCERAMRVGNRHLHGIGIARCFD